MLRKLEIGALIAILIVAIAFLPATIGAKKEAEIPNELPVYELTGPETKAKDLANKTFHMKTEKVKEVGESETDLRTVIEDEGKTLEVYKKSNGVRFEDKNKKLKPESKEAKEAKSTLPDKEKAKDTADKFLRDNNLQPADDVLELVPLEVTGTLMSIFDTANETREDSQLDVQVGYSLRLTDESEGLNISIIGPGAKYNVALGRGGEVIGYSGPKPEMKAVKEKKYKTKSKVDVEEEFKAFYREANITITNMTSELAYYIPSDDEDQKYMEPVWVLSGEVDEGLPTRNLIIPATERARDLHPSKVGKEDKTKRTKDELPRGGIPTDEDETQTEGSVKILQASSYEAGAEYIGTSGGLTYSRANAEGFLNEIRKGGWTIDFIWGDSLAFESDWNRNDDIWIDDEDIVFYSGHASMNGWSLSSPDDNTLYYTEVGPAGGARDIWGRNDLEWVAIAACGPLEDNVISSGGGSAITRWKGAFDGLHILMGYGAVTYDTPYEGQRFARYMREGNTVINSWFRAARESQPSYNTYTAPYGPRIYAGAMYAYKSGTTSPYNDHLWGYGSVAPDPIDPNVYVCMWSPC